MNTAMLADLYEQYRSRLFRHIYYRTGENVQTAEDLTAQIFAKAAASAARPAHPAAYLWRIAHNLIVDHYRERSRKPQPVSLDDLVDEYVGECDALEQCETNAYLAQLFSAANLTPLQFEALVLYWLAGWPSKDIAQRWGCEVESVKALLHRGMVKLRKAAQTH